jgi:hypothetical protein
MLRELVKNVPRCTWRAKWGLPLAALLVLALSFVLGRRVTAHYIAAAPVSATPFLLDLETYNFQDDPQGELVGKRTVARRSDGTTAVIDTTLGRIGLQHGLTSRKLQFMDGRTIALFDWAKVKSTWRQSGDRMAEIKARLLYPPENCVSPGYTFLGYGELHGLRVAIASHSHDGGQRTYWRAPSLGCQDLEVRDEGLTSSGSRGLRVETRTANLSLDEPEPELFTEGEGYEEVTPSEALRRGIRWAGLPWDDSMQRWADKADQGYFAAK